MTQKGHWRHARCCAATVALTALAWSQDTLVSPWSAPQHLSDDFRPRTVFGQDGVLTWIKAGGLRIGVRRESAAGVVSLRSLGTQTEFVAATGRALLGVRGPASDGAHVSICPFLAGLPGVNRLAGAEGVGSVVHLPGSSCLVASTALLQPGTRAFRRGRRGLGVERSRSWSNGSRR